MTTPHEAVNAGSSSKQRNTGGEKTNTSLAACLQCRSRKVRCNRELPKCQNCKKSGDPCEFPDPEKKANHAKALAENVAAFDGKLKSIEQSLTSRMDSLADLVSQSVKDPNRNQLYSLKSPSDGLDNLSNSDDADETRFDSETSPHSPSIIISDGSLERFYGESSTYSHLAHSKDLVEKLLKAGEERSPTQSASKPSSRRSPPDASNLANAESSMLAEVQKKYDAFSGPSKFREHFEIGDGKSLELPPRAELENAIESYLAEEGLEPPLFQKQTLDDAIDEQYGSNRLEIDESWALCFTNIILRSSVWKSRSFRINSFAPPSVDDNVLSLLLTNANRALRQLERFCLLRMVNVQGLFLLALVARDSIHYNVFERIFDRACQLAKQMGLHERGTVGENPTPEELERQSVLWVLYSVDKQRVFIRGPPCRIYHFECHLQLPQAQDSKGELIAANLRLTCLIEDVYRYLYSPKASRQDVRNRQKRVHQLQSRLEALGRQCENTMTAAQGGSTGEMTMSLQLRYAFYVTTLLIHGKSLDGESQHFRMTTARKALQIIQKLSGNSLIFNGYMVVVERLFCNYSVIAFHQVFDNMITANSAASSTDLSLLTAANTALRLLSRSDKPYSYCTRLQKNFNWCTEIATLIHSARKPASLHPVGSNSDIFDMNAPNAFNQFNFSQKSTSAPAPLSTAVSQPARDFEGDSPMDDSFQIAKGGPSSEPFTSMSSSFDPNDLASFQRTFSNDMFNTSDIDPSSIDMTDSLLNQPLDIPPESSNQFQDALQWVFDKGSDLDYNFQQVMTGQGMPMVPIGDNQKYTL